MYQLTFEDIIMLLLYNDNFLILTHKKPDGDTLGSGAALCLALREKGKTAFMHDSGEIGKRYYDLCKNLFPKKNFKADFIISVDVADFKLLPDNAQCYAEEIMLNIDHHPSNKNYAGHNYIDSNASATGEIIYDITEKLQIKASKNIMMPIYVAISTDTGCFCYSNTTAKAHCVAAKAIEAGVDVGNINKSLFETKSNARIAIERELYNNMKYFCDKQIAFTTLTRKAIEECKASEDDIDNLSAILRKIEGVECAVTGIEQVSGDMKISVRSGDRVDSSNVCALIGGGGHKRAAGAIISKENVKEQLSILLAHIEEELNG